MHSYAGKRIAYNTYMYVGNTSLRLCGIKTLIWHMGVTRRKWVVKSENERCRKKKEHYTTGKGTKRVTIEGIRYYLPPVSRKSKEKQHQAVAGSSLWLFQVNDKGQNSFLGTLLKRDAIIRRQAYCIQYIHVCRQHVSSIVRHQNSDLTNRSDPKKMGAVLGHYC